MSKTKRKTNKRAEIFLPAFVIITIVVFTTLAVVMQKNNAERQNQPPIGLQAVSLIKIQQEVNRDNFYLENSAKFAEQETLQTLAENAGYPKQNSCKKTKQTALEPSVIYFNKDCGPFNTEESFKTQFSVNLNNYLSEFSSFYPEVVEEGAETKWSSLLKKLFSEKFQISSKFSIADDLTNTIKKLEPSDIEIKTNSIELIFPAKRLPIEFSTVNSYFEFQPKFILPPINLNILNNLYSALSNCHAKLENCEAEIITEFPDAEIETQGEYLKINTHTDPEIKLLFNPKSELPEYKEAALR